MALAHATPAERLLTRKDYMALYNAGHFAPDARIELVGGRLYEMPSMNSPHSEVVQRLMRYFLPLLADQRLLVQLPVVISDFDEPEPDLAVRAKFAPHRSKPQGQDLALVIEVSDSTYGFDRNRKLPAYLNGGVAEVWLVNLPRMRVERYPRATAHVPEILYTPNPSATLEFEGVRIAVDELLGNLPRAEDE